MKELYGIKAFNWKNITKIPREDRLDAIVDAAQKALEKIQASPVRTVPLTHGEKLAGHDLNLMGAVPIALVMSDSLKSPDRGYEVLFDEVDMRNSTSDSFKIIDVSGGVTFYQQIAGQEAKLSRIPTSAVSLVGFLRFTGGFNVLDDWLRFNQYYLIDQLFADTVRSWYNQKANIFYGLLTALSAGINEAFSTDDATTINNACANILINLSAAGYAVDENAEFVLTCNPILKPRIFKALAAAYAMPNTNTNKVLHNIGTVISTTKIANTSYYVSLPGAKNQRGEWEDLNVRPPQRNEMVLGAAHIWTGAYNGAIGEAKQHRRCALS